MKIIMVTNWEESGDNLFQGNIVVAKLWKKEKKACLDSQQPS